MVEEARGVQCRVCGCALPGVVAVVQVGEVRFDLRGGVVCDACNKAMVAREGEERQAQAHAARMADGVASGLFPKEIMEYELRKYPRGENGAIVDYLRKWGAGDANVMLLGKAGVGKSTLGLCLVRRALKGGRMAGLVKAKDIYAAAGDFERGAAQLRAWGTLGLLVLDDLDKGVVTERGLNGLYTVLDLRHQRGLRTVVTGQVALSVEGGTGGLLAVWNKVVGNPTLAGAVLDRLLPLEVLRLVGESKRGEVRNHAPGTAPVAAAGEGKQGYWWEKRD